MTVTRDDAASALREIDRAGRHSRTVFRYWLASPYFLLWGALWIAAGAVGALSPGNAGLGWAAADAAGILGTAWLAVRQSRSGAGEGGRARTLRSLGTGAALAAFIGLTLTVFAPVTGVEIQTFIVLLVAAVYAIAGCWFGLRYAVMGAALAGLAIAAFAFAPADLAYIVPVLGGGALILGGLWMRRPR